MATSSAVLLRKGRERRFTTFPTAACSSRLPKWRSQGTLARHWKESLTPSPPLARIRRAISSPAIIRKRLKRQAFLSRASGLPARSEEHTSELQSLMRISSAVFCLKKKKHRNATHHTKFHTH